MGRPLALVRASLKLELAGLGPLAQGWDAVDFLDPKKGMLGLDAAKFPVFLGHPVAGLDGLVGYFVLDDQQKESAKDFQTLYMAYGLEGNDQASGDFHVRYKSGDPVRWTNTDPKRRTSPDRVPAPTVSLSRSLELLLLMYPEGGVTVTTGILPRQTFRLDTSDGGADLEEADAYFYTGPVVSPEDELRAPRPSDAYGQWSWTHRQNLDKWADPPEKLEGKDKGTEQPFEQRLWLREGWLKLVTYPLAIHNFRVEGCQPRDPGASPLEFTVKESAPYVLAWTASGADSVKLTVDGRSLFGIEQTPAPRTLSHRGAECGSRHLHDHRKWGRAAPSH